MATTKKAVTLQLICIAIFYIHGASSIALMTSMMRVNPMFAIRAMEPVSVSTSQRDGSVALSSIGLPFKFEPNESIRVDNTRVGIVDDDVELIRRSMVDLVYARSIERMNAFQLEQASS